MKTWKPGDKIGNGAQIIERENAVNYATQCRDELTDSLAEWVMRGIDTAERRARLSIVPVQMREIVSKKSIDIWNKRMANNV